MKKIFIIIVNIMIIASIVGFVVFYSGFASRDSYLRQVEYFENTTVTMEKITANYMEGEQRICDVWARYIINSSMTMEEAEEYIRTSHVLTNTSAHIIYLDTRTGLSTRSRQGTDDDYKVSYERVDLLDSIDLNDAIGDSIKITRAYTNPMNGEQSLAFCNKIKLLDKDSKTSRDAVLMRVMPISELEQKWVFAQTEFVNAELSMIDSGGNYILKGSGFKNSNFFEFYKSYNPADPESTKQLSEKVTSSTGSISMINSHGEECILAFTPVDSASGWTMLGLVPANDLNVAKQNWLLIGVVSAGLLILFLFDIFYMLSLNKRLQITTREAESANKAKTDFLSTMSHDIRTPMNAIIGLTAIAEKNLGDVESTEASLRKISLASNHLLTLINDILDISKVESGKLKKTSRIRLLPSGGSKSPEDVRKLVPLTFEAVRTALFLTGYDAGVQYRTEEEIYLPRLYDAALFARTPSLADHSRFFKLRAFAAGVSRVIFWIYRIVNGILALLTLAGLVLSVIRLIRSVRKKELRIGNPELLTILFLALFFLGLGVVYAFSICWFSSFLFAEGLIRVILIFYTVSLPAILVFAFGFGISSLILSRPSWKG